LIVTELDPRHGRCSLTIESADDLWTLRRLIAKGDVLVARSSRVVKREEEFSRPDRGERVKVTIALSVEEVHLDSSIERVRVRGSILESTDESITKAGSHAITLSPGHSVRISKKRWTSLDTRLVKGGKTSHTRYLIVAVDRREAGVGLISGSHLTILASIESGAGGKMSDEPSSAPFISKVASFISQAAREGDTVVVAGPGRTKNALGNQASADSKGRYPIRLLEGFDLSGPDGVRALVKFQGFKELAKESLLVEMGAMVGEAVRRISTGDARVAYALRRVKDAADAGAVDSCAVSDDIFTTRVDEEDLVATLNSIEGQKGRLYLADSSLEFGKQVSSLGGIVALLRYDIRSC
jgi:protein pelota